MPEPIVSVLIVTWNTRELTLRCLDSLARGTATAGPSQLLVVDNGSADGTAEALASRTDIELLRNGENVGFAAAVNQAYRRARGEFVLLLNSDLELEPGGLEALVQFLRDRPDAAGAAPLYRNPDGSPQQFHFRLPTFAMLLANASALVRLLPGSKRLIRDHWMLDEAFDKPLPVPQPSASCLLLRRAFLTPDRIFDERYPIFFNDVMFAREIAEAGKQLWVVPSAIAVHDAHSSTGRLGLAGKRQYLGAIIRMLQETEPARNLWLYRAIVFTQEFAAYAVRRPRALPPPELWRTLAGDVGPLPSAPATQP
jgi:GT2 family glycosyltransferase